MMRSLRAPLPLLGALALAACAEPAGVGGVTADIVFGPRLDASQRALRTAAPPRGVTKLQISALDTDGSTLATTILALDPGPDELPLDRNGGTWSLDAVPAGTNRALLGKAFYSSTAAPGLGEVLAFAGRRDGIEVRAGQTTQAGALVLNPTGERIPEIDFTPPDVPPAINVVAVPSGETLSVSMSPPPGDEDLGFLLAVATSSTAGQPVQLMRGRTYIVGERIGGATVHTVRDFAGPQVVFVEGLENNVPVQVLVYTFDKDRGGSALNYSAPAQALQVPADTSAPDVPGGLVARPVGTDRVEIQFVAPSEDGTEGGAPARYELRASVARAELEDVDSFAALAPVEPPPVATPGATVRFERTLDALGIGPGLDFFVGLRAVDASVNAGPIAVASAVISTTVAPALADVAPPIGRAGSEIIIRGDGFGTATGTVSIVPSETGTVTAYLVVSQWTNGEIKASVPVNARTGRLTVTRPDGGSIDTAYTVLTEIPGILDDYEFPFEVIGVGADAPAVHALYREEGEFQPYDGAIERFYDATPEGIFHAPAVNGTRSTAIAGDYSPALDRFLFVASDQNLSMTTALVTSSTITPDPFRLPIGVTAGLADRVSVVITGVGGPAEVPAMIAFTIGGTIRTATVTDARFQPFDGFFATTSTVQSYERVTLARRDDGALLMAHRTVTGTVAVLSLRDNAGGVDPSAFTPRVITSAPRVGDNFEILAAPLTPGGTQRFLIAYEALRPDGTTQVRLLWADDLGTGPGLAPLPPGDRRLDDVGLVIREGEVFVAVASTRVVNGVELTYTEVPISALSDPNANDGAWPGVVMDSAPQDYVARLGCKPFLQAHCPIIWAGDRAGAFFLRR